MKIYKSKSVNTLCAMLVLLFVGSAYGYENTSPEAMLPEGLIIEDIFKPGLGLPVGKVELVQGDAVIMHADDMLTGYLARKNLPLYKGDTIITRERGRIRFKLNDGSILTLASVTKQVLTRSVYDPKKKSRSSFFGMSFGKARFWVMKLAAFKHSQFKVKTPTAVVGVRGSDFIIKVTKVNPYFTEVIALGDTKLEIVSLAAPEKPAFLSNFEKIMIEEGLPPSEVEKVSPEEVEKYNKDFAMPDAGEGPEGGIEGEGKKAGKTLVSEDELVDPDDTREPLKPEEPFAPDFVAEEEITGHEEDVMEQQEEIYEEIHEMEEEITELPPMPGTPE